MISIPEANRLNSHYAKQDTLAKQLPAINKAIKDKYINFLSMELKDKLKLKLKESLHQLNDGEKLAIVLVDIQNDFVLEGFALYAPGGENTVLSNMALLDAIRELKYENPTVSQQIAIVTSQDAHALDRSETTNDYKVIRRKYPDTSKAILEGEANELKPFDPAKSQFGLHCMNGTVGAAIATPIEERLRVLEALEFNVKRFIKTNFSGPQAGLELPKGVKVGDKKYRNQNIYSLNANPQTYLEFFKKEKFVRAFFSGICANVCVQQAVEGLREDHSLDETALEVIDAAQHFLVVPNITNYDDEKAKIESSYQEKNIDIMILPGFRSNPELESNKDQKKIASVLVDFKPQQSPKNSAFFSFYLAHAASFKAILAAVAVAAVVLLLAQTIVLAPLALTIAATAFSAGVAGGFTFFNHNHRERQAQNKAEENYAKEELGFTIA